MKKYIFVLLMMIATVSYSQTKQKVTGADYENAQVEMADNFRTEGKIYVVVAILATVLAGFIVYAVRIDTKLSKIEKEIKNKN